MTHRFSFPKPDSDNEFYEESPQGWVFDTETQKLAVCFPNGMTEKFLGHQHNGYHPDCVICQQAKADALKTPVLYAEALLAALDDDNLPVCRADIPRPDLLVTARLDCGPCPLTDPEQIEAEQKMREENAIDQIADAKRENRFGVGL